MKKKKESDGARNEKGEKSSSWENRLCAGFVLFALFVVCAVWRVCRKLRSWSAPQPRKADDAVLPLSAAKRQFSRQRRLRSLDFSIWSSAVFTGHCFATLSLCLTVSHAFILIVDPVHC